MPLTIERFATAGAFLGAAGEFLTAREAEHNLMLGICSHLAARSPAVAPYLAVVRDGPRVVAAALRTPPHQLVLSEMDEVRPVAVIAHDVRTVFDELSGVLAAPAAAAELVRCWESLTTQKGRIGVRQRIYRAETAQPPGPTPRGRARPAASADRELLVAWFQAFALEAMPNDPGAKTSVTDVDRRLANPDNGLLLWEDDGGRPVSLAGFGGATPHGMRIGPVYTPPEHRRRGFAGALTHAITRMLFDRGRRFCFLYTDRANPTSNAIYQRIGYQPVTDADQWLFA